MSCLYMSKADWQSGISCQRSAGWAKCVYSTPGEQGRGTAASRINSRMGGAMHRSFETTSSRTRIELEGPWDFRLDPDDEGGAQEWYAQFPEDTTALWVPGVWNTRREYLGYEGVGWYRRRFVSETTQPALVRFAAVTHQAHVWLDGEPLGEHYGGFLPFQFLVPTLEVGEHELVVRVDNTHDMTSTVPSANLDWYRYGGIHRPVWVEGLGGDGLVVSLRLTPVVKGGACTLRVRAELCNLTDRLLDGAWCLTLDGETVRSGNIGLYPSDNQVLLFAVDVDAELWSPSNPRLYTARLSFAGDDLVERTGFREISIRGDQILLNGEPLRIRGVNRHEDHPDWGLALPEPLMLRDLELIEHLGANAIRGSHYPNDPRFLDLCDERGVLFIEEIPLWGYTAAQFASETIEDRAAAMVWAMVQRDVNHPAIWAWSVLNECATQTPEGRAVVERLIDTAREADPTRPVTYASDKGVDDICYDLADFVCLNAYYGWYVHDLTWRKYLDRIRARIGDKPMIVSEFGAGAIYGWHALEEGVVWSEEYARDVLCDAISHFLARPDLAGFFVWQFFDTRTDGGQRALRRPRNYNNKGLLDEYRRPKLGYYAVRDLLREERGD